MWTLCGMDILSFSQTFLTAVAYVLSFIYFVLSCKLNVAISSLKLNQALLSQKSSFSISILWQNLVQEIKPEHSYRTEIHHKIACHPSIVEILKRVKTKRQLLPSYSTNITTKLVTHTHRTPGTIPRGYTKLVPSRRPDVQSYTTTGTLMGTEYTDLKYQNRSNNNHT